MYRIVRFGISWFRALVGLGWNFDRRFGQTAGHYSTLHRRNRRLETGIVVGRNLVCNVVRSVIVVLVTLNLF